MRVCRTHALAGLWCIGPVGERTEWDEAAELADIAWTLSRTMVWSVQ